MHELPNCVECLHYRLKAGRCTNCGAIGPDDIQWEDSCLDEDEDYDRLMYPILEKRNLTIKMNSKKIQTYDNCPLCRGYFHSAKACIFRKHALYFSEMKQQIQELTQPNSQPKELLLPKVPMKMEISVQEKEDIEVDEDEQPIMMFDRILRVLQSLQITDATSTETQTMEEDQEFQPTVLQETSCELTKEKFNISICKILPDAADFPDDLFNVEGCVW